jgi:hypothetical protein
MGRTWGSRQLPQLPARIKSRAVEDSPEQSVLTEEMHPDRPDGLHRGICTAMILFGVALIATAVLFHLPGALRFFLGAAGVVVAILGFCFALGVTRVGIKASGDGGIEASADMPTGYTRTMTISKSLRGGSSPAKFGHPPPREGVMPPKDGKMPSKRAP